MVFYFTKSIFLVIVCFYHLLCSADALVSRLSLLFWLFWAISSCRLRIFCVHAHSKGQSLQDRIITVLYSCPAWFSFHHPSHQCLHKIYSKMVIEPLLQGSFAAICSRNLKILLEWHLPEAIAWVLMLIAFFYDTLHSSLDLSFQVLLFRCIYLRMTLLGWEVCGVQGVVNSVFAF